MRKNPVFQQETFAAAILKVRSGLATSRTTLAKSLGISPSTIGLYVDRLIADGWLNESGLNQGPMGRPRRLLTTVPEAGWFAGVEFNAHRLQAVAVDFSGRAAASHSIWLPANVTVPAVIEAIHTSVTALAKAMHGQLLSVGLGAPGLVNSTAGIGLRYAFIADWVDVPLVGQIESRLKVPVILENNLRAIALAERWFGLGHDVSDYVILGPRSGFGIAMVMRGQLIEGAHHAAGEVGLWPWPLAGSTGGEQELHHVLSATATWRRLAGVPAGAKLPDDLRAALAEHATMEGTTWDAVCSDFGRVIGFLRLVLDAEIFILHGPLTALGDRFCEAIVAHGRQIMPALQGVPFKVTPSALGDDAGALGAASLAMEAWSPAA
ncbi:MAG: ROK family protein [Prosthecobacter sp.]|jgi:predicted NBD/HSP70 family sugar kinase|nr:ROK family protein [Prosthecobacter sp.]